jgi:hypothetical protein
MMKKLGMFALVMALVVAFALPAFAYTVEGAKGERFTMGGTLRYDFGYRNIDKDRSTWVPDAMTPPGQDRTYFFNGISTSTSLYVSFTVGDISGYANIFTYVSPGYYHAYSDNRVMGPTTVNSAYSINNSSGSFKDQNNNAAFDLVYGTYKFGDMQLQAGRLPALTVVQVPNPGLGYLTETGGHINAISYGYIYENKVPALRFTHYVNKMINYSFQLSMPSVFGEDANTAAAPATGTPQTVNMPSNFTLRDSYAQYPRIGGRIGINVGPASINPGFGYEQIKWDGLPAGWTDSMTAWFVRVPVRLTFGPFVALLEGLYGQNLGGRTSNQQTMVSSESADSMYKRNAAGTILDANSLNLWADFAYTIGPVTPHLYAGFATYYNDKAFTTGQKDTTRTFYGINAPYNITPNFRVVPEFSLYDLGKVQANGAKLGVDWLLGVQFQFNF